MRGVIDGAELLGGRTRSRGFPVGGLASCLHRRAVNEVLPDAPVEEVRPIRVDVFFLARRSLEPQLADDPRGAMSPRSFCRTGREW